jgi:type IV secretion system protein VirD4
VKMNKNTVIFAVFATLYFASTLLITKIVYFLLGFSSRSVGILDYFLIIIHYYNNPAIISKFMAVSALVFLLITLTLVAGLRARRKPKLHGKSDIASTKDIGAMGLFSNDGLILAEKDGKLLRAPGLTPTILTAPTRAEKGVAIVIPNCIAHKGSLLAYDPKLELYRTCARHRQNAGQNVFLWGPGMPFTHRWNPFDMFNAQDPDLYDNIDIIANILCPTPPDSKDPMWTQNGRRFFIGAVFAMFDMGDYVTLPAVRDWIDFYQMSSDDDEDDEDSTTQTSSQTLTAFLAASQGRLGSIAETNLTFIDALPKVTGSGVKGQIMSSLAVFQSPSVAHAFSSSDFDLRTIRKNPVSIFVGSTKRTLTTGRAVYSLFFQMATMLLTENLPRKNEGHHVLMCLDEFTGLGPMDVIKRAVADIAGYNVRLFIILQNFAQVKNPKMYGSEGLTEFLGNMEYEIYYRPKMLNDAKELSLIMGDNTVKTISKSSSGFMTGLNLKGQSQNASETKRALMLPQELMRMNDNEVLILKPGKPPVIATKLIYYADKRFKGMFYDLHKPENTPTMQSPDIPLVPIFKSKYGDMTSNDFWEEGLDEADAVEHFKPNQQPRPPVVLDVETDALAEQASPEVMKRKNKITFDKKNTPPMPPIGNRKISKREQKRYTDKYLNKHFEFDGSDLLGQSIAENMSSQAVRLGDPSVHEDKSTEGTE